MWNIFDQDEYWMTKYFSKVKISSMSDSHLQNTISMLNRNPKSFANIAYNNFVRDDTDYIEDDPIVQDLTLGVDTGSSKIGTAVVDSNKNVYYVSEVTIRNDISKKMTARRQSRRQRRTRKLRYRKPRFLNRANSTKNDRFSPTMISKINSHTREIEFVKSILPIKTLVVETGTFDPRLLKHIEDGIAFNKHWGLSKRT